jgi:hypothetical protein
VGFAGCIFRPHEQAVQERKDWGQANRKLALARAALLVRKNGEQSRIK